MKDFQNLFIYVYHFTEKNSTFKKKFQIFFSRLTGFPLFFRWYHQFLKSYSNIFLCEFDFIQGFASIIYFLC